MRPAPPDADSPGSPSDLRGSEAHDASLMRAGPPPGEKGSVLREAEHLARTDLRRMCQMMQIRVRQGAPAALDVELLGDPTDRVSGADRIRARVESRGCGMPPSAMSGMAGSGVVVLDAIRSVCVPPLGG